MKWYKETVYIQRDESTGAIVRIEENKPFGYKSTYELRNEKKQKSSEEIEKEIKAYEKLKEKKKRLTIGE